MGIVGLGALLRKDVCVKLSCQYAFADLSLRQRLLDQ